MTHRYPERIALFPGTFNPFTRGHMSIVSRALALFDRVVIGVGYSPAKPDSADGASRRAEHIAALFAGEPRVEVTAYTGLTVDVCRRIGARFIVRGVRSVTDFEYERGLADVNRQIGDGIETVLLYSLPGDTAVSSSMVRELQSHGVDVSRFLPKTPEK